MLQVPSRTSRTLVVDEEFEEQFIHCQICIERFDQAERIPKILPCHHTFCLPCLTQISRSGKKMLKCPMCSQECRIAQTCKEFPADHRVIGLLDWMSRPSAHPEDIFDQAPNMCPKHTGEKVLFICETCIAPACQKCTVLDHKKSNGHTITEITHVLTKQNTRLRTVENKSKTTLQQLQTLLDGLRQSLKALDKSKDQHTNEIKQKFIQFRSKLDQYEEILISRERQRNNQQRSVLQGKHDNVYVKSAQLQKLFNDFLCEDKDATKLLNTAHKMCAQENYLQQLLTQDDKSTNQITAEHENAFQSDMSKVEAIWSRSEPGLEDLERQFSRLSFTLSRSRGAIAATASASQQQSSMTGYSRVPHQGLHRDQLALNRFSLDLRVDLKLKPKHGEGVFSRDAFVNPLQCNARVGLYFDDKHTSPRIDFLFYLFFDRSIEEIRLPNSSIKYIKVKVTLVDPLRKLPDRELGEYTSSWDQLLQGFDGSVMFEKRPGYRLATIRGAAFKYYGFYKKHWKENEKAEAVFMAEVEFLESGY